MTITGIDVSGYQSETYDLTGADFVFVKATEGTSYTNPRHAAQVTRARNNDRVVGHYHYLNGTSVTAQIDYFLKQAGAKAGDVFAVDWEETAVTGAAKDQALKYLQQKAPGHRVLLYCNRDFWLNRDTSSYRADGLWIAQYNGKPGAPDIEAPWVVHQYTSDPIDTNVAAFSSRSAMAAWAAGTEEDDVAGLTADDVKKVWTTDGIIKNPNTATAPTNPYIAPMTSLYNIETIVRRMETAEAAQTAAITALAKLVGSGANTATIVAAVQDAIAKAVVHVDVDVTGPASS
ncbi:GH25 family lysozyme [Streptomyces sp. NPDC008150]|uniref:glycoside hydrolase family 25 protein n=1 Tax=Streptomyces sp. NPDC008150 TaxID=3364816 RepID=UPI0036EE7A3D